MLRPIGEEATQHNDLSNAYKQYHDRLAEWPLHHPAVETLGKCLTLRLTQPVMCLVVYNCLEILVYSTRRHLHLQQMHALWLWTAKFLYVILAVPLQPEWLNLTKFCFKRLSVYMNPDNCCYFSLQQQVFKFKSQAAITEATDYNFYASAHL